MIKNPYRRSNAVDPSTRVHPCLSRLYVSQNHSLSAALFWTRRLASVMRPSCLLRPSPSMVLGLVAALSWPAASDRAWLEANSSLAHPSLAARGTVRAAPAAGEGWEESPDLSSFGGAVEERQRRPARLRGGPIAGWPRPAEAARASGAELRRDRVSGGAARGGRFFLAARWATRRMRSARCRRSSPS